MGWLQRFFDGFKGALGGVAEVAEEAVQVAVDTEMAALRDAAVSGALTRVKASVAKHAKGVHQQAILASIEVLELAIQKAILDAISPDDDAA